jgi:hypothetical protein
MAGLERSSSRGETRPALTPSIVCPSQRWILVGSMVGLGYLSFSDFMASTMIWETATLRYHLWSEGMTNQGACFLLVASMASS